MGPETPESTHPPEARDGGSVEADASSLRARLAVAPLDDLTRERLVRAAVAAAPRRRRRAAPWTAAAAVLLVVTGATLAVLLHRSDEPGPQAARPAPASRPAVELREDAGTPQAAEGEVADAALGVADLGDLGEVGSRAALRRAVASAATTGSRVLPRCAFDVLRDVGRPTAAGNGTAGGRAVIVVVVARPDGTRVAVVLSGGHCTLGGSVDL